MSVVGFHCGYVREGKEHPTALTTLASIEGQVVWTDGSPSVVSVKTDFHLAPEFCRDVILRSFRDVRPRFDGEIALPIDLPRWLRAHFYRSQAKEILNALNGPATAAVRLGGVT